jgi:hypothetical protein
MAYICQNSSWRSKILERHSSIDKGRNIKVNYISDEWLGPLAGS